MELKGIDVSLWQGDINWAAAAGDGVDFAMIKATQGRASHSPDSLPFTDPKFEQNINGAFSAGIAVGAYHYFCADTAEQALREADYFISRLTPVRDKISLWCAVDVEDSEYLGALSPEALTEAVNLFCERIKSAGFRPMVYANQYYLNSKLKDISAWALWLARWDVDSPGRQCDIWQVSSSGSIRGINGRVDINRGYFTLPEKEKIKITYSIFARGTGWLPRVTDWNDYDYNGYAGYMGRPAQALKADVSRGHVRYRAHGINGVWYDWVTDSTGGGYNGYAGVPGIDMDGLQMSLTELPGRHIEYRVHLKGGGWLPWVRDYGGGAEGYAGIYGKPFDALQCRVV